MAHGREGFGGEPDQGLVGGVARAEDDGVWQVGRGGSGGGERLPADDDPRLVRAGARAGVSGERGRQRLPVGERQQVDPFAAAERVGADRAGGSEPGKVGLDDGRVDPFEVVVVHGRDGLGDVDGGRERGFLLLRGFRGLGELVDGQGPDLVERGAGGCVVVAVAGGEQARHAVFGQPDELADEAEAVEHPAFELVSRGDEVAEQDREDVAFAGHKCERNLVLRMRAAAVVGGRWLTR